MEQLTVAANWKLSNITDSFGSVCLAVPLRKKRHGLQRACGPSSNFILWHAAFAVEVRKKCSSVFTCFLSIAAVLIPVTVADEPSLPAVHVISTGEARSLSVTHQSNISGYWDSSKTWMLGSTIRRELLGNPLQGWVGLASEWWLTGLTPRGHACAVALSQYPIICVQGNSEALCICTNSQLMWQIRRATFVSWKLFGAVHTQVCPLLSGQRISVWGDTVAPPLGTVRVNMPFTRKLTYAHQKRVPFRKCISANAVRQARLALQRGPASCVLALGFSVLHWNNRLCPKASTCSV